MRDLAKELAVTGLLAAIAATSLASLHMTERPALSFQYSSGLPFSALPNLYAGLLLFLCLLNAGKAVWRHKRENQSLAKEKKPTGRAVATVALLLSFVFLLGKAPFAALCAVFLCLLFLVYGKRKPLQMACIALGGAAALHLVFVSALGLRL
ncbi:MAG: tripartite tricarboxylate transporter TctB family protein [Desulfovibrio sp.]|jgi:hypothetical protein|nr:tripartite tricarboxylate transporter TctB family protein [Desulfovibrio sp.]